MIDYAPDPDRDAMLAKIKSELRAEHRGLTDVQVDLIADVAIELRILRDSFWHRADDVRARTHAAWSAYAAGERGVDESRGRS